MGKMLDDIKTQDPDQQYTADLLGDGLAPKQPNNRSDKRPGASASNSVKDFKPPINEKETKTLVGTYLRPTLIKAIDDTVYENRWKSRSALIEQILENFFFSESKK